MFGEADLDTLLGGEGADYIDGGSEADSVLGGIGNDELRAGTGAGDQVFGEAGADILLGSNDGADLLDGGAGDDQLSGQAGNDTLRGQDGADIADGGAGDDLIEGYAGADILVGGADHDSIYGHSAAGSGDDGAIDTLFGDFATGTDDVGAGRDQLFGGTGFDVLLGEGNDDFIADFGSNDTVNFGAGDGATPNNFIAPTPTPAPTLGTNPPLAARGVSLPVGALPAGRWAEIAGQTAGGALGRTSSSPVAIVDSLDRRYIAWSDARNGNFDIYVARHDGTSWTALGGSAGNGSAGNGSVSNNGSASTDPSIAIDASGNPVVAWSDGGNVYVARYDGSAWVSMGGSNAGGGIGGAGNATSPKLVSTASGIMVGWLDASTGAARVYVKRFNGTGWVEPVAGSASGNGVSGLAPASQLAMASNGTNVSLAWTATINALPQVYLREFDGTTWAERAGSASGDGASLALYGASEPTIAYAGSTVHLAFVAQLAAASPLSGIVTRRFDGSAWADSDPLAAPVAGVRGVVTSPRLVSNGTTVRLGWLEQRNTFDVLRTSGFAMYTGTHFVSVLPASSEGFATAEDSLSLAIDSTGKLVTATSERGQVAAQVEGLTITRIFTASATTTVQSILDANDLGPGDAIVISGSVAGFTLAGDDAGVLLVSDRTNPGIVVGVTAITAADVQVVGITFANTTSINGANSVLRGIRSTFSMSLAGSNITVAGNTFTGPVSIGVASSGVIAGNTFDTNNVGTTPALTISAAFTGSIRHNTFSRNYTGVSMTTSAPFIGNDFVNNLIGVKVAGVTLGTGATEANRFRGNATGVQLVSSGAVVRQAFRNNTTGVFGVGTVGGTTLADANVFDNNITGVDINGTVQFNRFTRNGVAVIAKTGSSVFQNQITTSTGDGIRTTGPRVVITHNSVSVSGRAVDVASGSSEVEVVNNVLVSTGTGHALYVDNAGQSGFWSDYNLLHAEPGGHLVHWFADFDDLLDWQQDVNVFDLHSRGRTAVEPSATTPRFIGTADLSAHSAVGSVRASSPAVDMGDPLADIGVTASRTNLLNNPSFETGTTAGWNTNATGSTLTTPLTPWNGSRYFTTGASTNGFAEQTINLLSAGFTTTQLDSQDLAATFGVRMRGSGPAQAIITFLNGSNAVIGTSKTYTGTASSTRWLSLGGRERLPLGTRAITVRFQASDTSTAFDAGFAYVDNDALAPNVGFGGNTPNDSASALPRIQLRSVDLYTDLILDKPTVIRWDTFGDTADRPVRIDLLQDGPNGAAYLMTLSAAAPDTGSFEFRPLDFGLSAGTTGYRVRLSLVGDDIAFDRSTEPSTIPQTGEQYYVDDASNINDEFTPGAVGSNRNTGKSPGAPKPLVTSVLRIYDTGPASTINVDTGSYLHFATALLSGTTGVGDDEGVTIAGPTDPAKVANLTTAATFAAFTLSDADATTLRALTINNASDGVQALNGSGGFIGQRLTIVSPTLRGVYIDSGSGVSSLDQLSISGAGTRGVWSVSYLPLLTNSSITGSGDYALLAESGVGTVSGNLIQGNLGGIQVAQLQAPVSLRATGFSTMRATACGATAVRAA
ncbi:MAG: hypothetical protein QM770_24760 [Tepidisphaeraceae bacterium]